MTEVTTSAPAGANSQPYDTNTLYCCNVLNIFPQLGTGSLTPSPKKDGVASAATYCGTSSAAWVSRTPNASGKTWRRRRQKSEAPKPRAAETKLRERVLRTTPRPSRAGRAPPIKPLTHIRSRNVSGGLRWGGRDGRTANKKKNHGHDKNTPPGPTHHPSTPLPHSPRRG